MPDATTKATFGAEHRGIARRSDELRESPPNYRRTEPAHSVSGNWHCHTAAKLGTFCLTGQHQQGYIAERNVQAGKVHSDYWWHRIRSQSDHHAELPKGAFHGHAIRADRSQRWDWNTRIFVLGSSNRNHDNSGWDANGGSHLYIPVRGEGLT